MHSPKILLLNASRVGKSGNTQTVLDHAAACLGHAAETRHIALQDISTLQALTVIEASDAILIGTGTHWDSWSSTLQRFLEEATPTEGSATWLGKPVGIIVTEHSAGGKGVLSRLQGVFTTFGCLIPPMSGMVYSLAAKIAKESAKPEADDMWGLDDIRIVTHNLLIAAQIPRQWETWPVDRTGYERRWID